MICFGIDSVISIEFSYKFCEVIFGGASIVPFLI
jgi:hypothetical protein